MMQPTVLEQIDMAQVRHNALMRQAIRTEDLSHFEWCIARQSSNFRRTNESMDLVVPITRIASRIQLNE